jgi:hypothetical protein
MTLDKTWPRDASAVTGSSQCAVQVTKAVNLIFGELSIKYVMKVMIWAWWSDPHYGYVFHTNGHAQITGRSIVGQHDDREVTQLPSDIVG